MFKERLIIAVVLSGIGCGDPSMGLDDGSLVELGDQAEGEPTQSVSAVQLLKPAANAVIPQNDSTIGCAPNPTRGYGFRIVFEWELIEDTAVSGYEVYVKHRGSQLPFINVFVDTTNHVETACNGFVADHNLEHWDWRVRALLPTGDWDPWTDTATFEFEPCRHADGRKCSAPG